jgi:poly-gamma-glutamate capsule biosynthesis protein CapA/YwtB (metallophosphatase superfamily)
MLTLRAVGDMVFDLTPPDWDDPGFAPIHQLLSAADLSFGNLEAPLTDKGTPISKLDITRSNTAAADIMKKLGIEVAALGNNHIMDYSQIGLDQTMTALDSHGILYCGAGSDESEAFRAVFCQTAGKRVAFLSFFAFHFPGMERYTDPIAADGCPGVAVVRSFLVRQNGEAVAAPEERFLKKLEESIRAARAEADYVVVSMHSHFGLECADIVDPARRQIAHCAVDAGADLILGHGPHTTNGFEFYNGAFIAHSLGNFYFHFPRQAVIYTYPDSSFYVPKYLADDNYWEGLMLEARFEDARPTELILTPIGIDREEVPFQGMPRIGDAALAQKMGQRLAEHSQGMGVQIAVESDRIRIIPA